MIRTQYPFFYKRYAYDLATGMLHDLTNEKSDCKIDELDEENIEMYSSLNETSLMLDHPTYKKCPHCMSE
ncbi:hypothetical protein OW763_03685 [Clostridium aestuarii]|uniref:Uncharacterized protein n=1 Tax=Clostridium aestuarii TaxID=338193 RepID=A0ABT4CWW0_9CLOT|nr:hypothetical protein [Clostridium aestuarii]MCY6483459.1 hypothetical protein [Clostridium aestuarii]